MRDLISAVRNGSPGKVYLSAEGHTSKEIAERLGISETTVKTHRNHIMEKLNVQETAGMTRHAIRLGLVRAD